MVDFRLCNAFSSGHNGNRIGGKMKKHVLMVLSNPVAGREEEYNYWYSHIHLADVLAIPGFQTARRFKLASSEYAMGWQYLAIYEFVSDDVEETIQALMSRVGSDAMLLSDAMNMDDYHFSPWVELEEVQA